MTLPFDPALVAPLLLDWYGREGRDLPWRNTRDPYRVWLSEIMLQQTTVAAVIPYYQRFLKRLPTIDALAKATLDEVISLWAGLGYYSRARNLHKTAQQVVAEYDGRFPDRPAALTSLPGIGRSTAGAILSIAFDQPAPILDGNVRRVLVRLFAWSEDPRSSRAEKQLWEWAELLTPGDRAHDYAQAIMDLGAMVCTPRQPDCPSCPLGQICLARKNGLAEILPVARISRKVPVRRQVALVIRCEGGVLLRQRPTEGFLGGLWEFPATDVLVGESPHQAASRLLADLGLHGGIVRERDVKHAYSHFKLELSVFSAAAAEGGMVAEGPACHCFRAAELEVLPLHGAHRKALQTIRLPDIA